MLRITLRTLLAHRVRLAMTALAIALGVAFMSGTFTFTATLRHQLDRLFHAASAGDDIVVRHLAPAGAGGGNSGVRPPLPAALVDQIRAVSGVDAADGVLVEPAQLTTVDGKLAGGGPGLATTWRPDTALDAAFPLHAGRAPVVAGEVAIDQSSANSDGYRVGDRVGVVIDGRRNFDRVVGIVGFGNGNGPGRSLVILNADAAAELFDRPGQYDEIDVKVAAGQSTESVRSRIAAGLPGDAEAVTAGAVASEQSRSLRGDLGFLTDALLGFAGIALLVGGFVIWNTFSILVAGRIRELALLRAVGASRRQVFGSVLVEAALLGLASSVIGVGLGVLAARGLAALLATFGLDLPATAVTLPAVGTSLAVVTGVLVTVAAAVAPARRATTIAPVAAMRDAAPSPYQFSRARIATGLLLVGAGAAGLAATLSGAIGSAALVSGVGAVAILFGVTILAPSLARPVVTAVALPLLRLPGRVGRLARDNAVYNPRRTAATAAALMIGLAAVTASTVLIDSVKSTTAGDIGRASRADLYVTPANPDSVLDPGLARAIAAQPGVAAISQVRRSDAVVAGQTHQAVYGIDPATIGQLTDLGVRTGSVDALRAGDLLVSTRVAAAHHWHVGSTVTAQFGQASKGDLRIGGTFAHPGPVGDYLLDLPTFDRLTGRPLDGLILVKATTGTSLAGLRATLGGLLTDDPGVRVLDTAGYQSASSAMFNQLVNLTTGLLVLAIVIALLGIANTLALSVTERTRELGVLRAIGMRRGQLAATITTEAGVVAVFGGVLGVLLGAGLGLAISKSLAGATPDLHLPVGQLVVYLVVAVVAAMLAAAAPARHAARMDVLRAIATE